MSTSDTVPRNFSPRPFSCCGFPATPSFRPTPSCGAWRIWLSGRRSGEDFMLEDLAPTWQSFFGENDERPGYHTDTQTHRHTDTKKQRNKETKKTKNTKNTKNQRKQRNPQARKNGSSDQNLSFR